MQTELYNLTESEWIKGDMLFCHLYENLEKKAFKSMGGKKKKCSLNFP